MSASCKDEFLLLQKELDAKHDKYERVIRQSRECTSQSKKMIFHLHRTYLGSDEDTDASSGRDRIVAVSRTLKEIAKDVTSNFEDPSKYRPAYTAGVQEFVEALGYWTFCHTGLLVTPAEVQSWLTFTSEEQQGTISLPLASIDFVLGIADLTGELMRLSIDSATRGDTELPFKLLPLMRDMYSEFLKLPPINKELLKKIEVLESSLMKVERVCYNLTIRRSERPGNLLSNTIHEDMS